ncbi:MAG TPA: hypothetical protein VG147_01745 [Solirubrobacteraceae bacterium]|nr:hypothetical protein [Solirubrobacteraceae bacterium]
MRFAEFLKTTVLLSAGVATVLALITVLSILTTSGSLAALLSVAWWAIAALIGLALGRGADANPPIARLLAGARSTNMLPEHRPAAILLNRLWPLLAVTVLAGGLAFLAPQIPGIGAGFAIIWALAWRHQHSAVTAIEERDGVRFYVLHTSPVQPIALQRTPGFKAMRPEGLV